MKINNNTIAKTIGVVVMTIFLLSILTACASKPKPAKGIDPIANAKTLGKALGCVMAPNTCLTSEEQKIKEEKEFEKEFKKIDQQKDKSN